ncbi:histidinol dehydrogenase [Clostridium sp. WILCCON 0269]|uniref:Histidinol dehydrogenase n=1 Tax=Candidatus Clostridium eludens TaxID=3381663 RepID=A0ABW8SMP7_9CLOT
MKEQIISTVEANTEEGRKYLNNFRNKEEEVQQNVVLKVNEILKHIKENGDNALIKYTNEFDSSKVSKENMLVTSEEIKKAYKLVECEFIEALKAAAENIKFFHEKQKRTSWVITKEDGIILGQQIRPLETVGIYVPGGTAAYPSSVLMNALPAKVAGVKEIIMVTPPLQNGTINPNILVAADIAGVDKIYKVGGAQAIGALAFGTESIDKVDKIVGPGNIFVAMAKKSVYGFVDIDMIAGPSEILIIADERSKASYLAADLMSQAEHDLMASSVLITTSKKLAEEVKEELEKQIKTLKRKDIIEKSLRNYGAIILVENMKEAIDIANKIAPEHLEICVEDPFLVLGDIKNAGSIFLGDFSPEPLGDYMAGPNHVLPTSGTARFFSPLSVDDFIKKASFTHYSQKALSKIGDKIVKLAEGEGLTAHANSIIVRTQS